MNRSAVSPTLVKLGVAVVAVSIVTWLALDQVRRSRPATLTQFASPGAAAGFNVLLITLDTTRADHLGCYGHEAARTPAIDSLVFAVEGLVEMEAERNRPPVQKIADMNYNSIE